MPPMTSATMKPPIKTRAIMRLRRPGLAKFSGVVVGVPVMVVVVMPGVVVVPGVVAALLPMFPRSHNRGPAEM